MGYVWGEGCVAGSNTVRDLVNHNTMQPGIKGAKNTVFRVFTPEHLLVFVLGIVFDVALRSIRYFS